MRSLNRFAMPEPVYFGWENCVLISIAVPVKLGMGLFYYFANKKLKSKALSAIMLDSFLDTGMSATSLISFAISSKIDYAVDAVFGVIMSIVVIAFAVKMIYDNAKCVVVGDGAEEEREAISAICKEENVEEVSLVLHDYGYGAKCGKLILCATDREIDDAVCARIKHAIGERTGADVDVYINRNNEQSGGLL